MRTEVMRLVAQRALALLCVCVVGTSLFCRFAGADDSKGDEANADNAKADKTKIEEQPEAIRHDPITVSGIAYTPDGEPLPNASVYLASSTYQQKLLASTLTDENGRYRFVDAMLPIDPGEHPTDNPYGQFEVFGQAHGFGFAWHRAKFHRPGQSDYRHNLRFSTPARFSGRIIDDAGQPIPNVKVGLFNAQPVPDEGYEKSRDFFRTGPQDFTILYNSRVIPDEMRNRKTDQDGRFSFDELPTNTGFRISLGPPKGFASRMIHATTATPDKIRFKDRKIEFDMATLVFRRTRSVPVAVTYGDTGMPAKNVFVEIHSRGGGQYKITDATGKVELELPPGEYRASYLTEHQTPYISRYSVESILTHTVQPIGTDQRLLEIKLEPAGILDIEIVDATTKKGLKDVDVWVGDGTTQSSYQWRSWKPPRLSMVERPTTDANGKLRLFVKPGLIVVGPGDQHPPQGYPRRTGGKEIAIKGGERRSVRLEMSRE